MKTSLFATLAAIVLTATSAFAAPTSMQQGLEGPADYRGRNDCQPYDHGLTTASPSHRLQPRPLRGRSFRPDLRL
jgi:hypothetical protein